MNGKNHSQTVENRLELIIKRLSSFEALLAEVVIGLVFFIVLVEGHAVVQASVPNSASLSVTWNQPLAIATETTTGQGKNCYGYVGCVITGLWPGQRVDYNVVVNIPGQPRTNIATGTGYATSSGSFNVNWTWTYGIEVYPDIGGSCQASGSGCVTRLITSNNSSFNETFGDLMTNTNYRKIVCTPGCAFGAAQVSSTSQLTGNPAHLNGVITSCNFGTAPVSVNAYFGWNQATGASYDNQYVDYSVYNNSFASGSFKNGIVPISQNGYSATGLAQGVTYYWRVNSHIAGTIDGWVTSTTGSITMPTCGAVQVSCNQVDFDRNGVITFSDLLNMNSHLAPAPYNSLYDLDHNGAVNSNDQNLMYSQWYGKACPTHDYATGLSANSQCTGLVPGNIVDVNFKWTPAVGGVYARQFIDYDVYPHGDTGWPPPPTAIQTLAGASFRGPVHGFAQNVTYYWRINTQSSDGIWHPSQVLSFKTPTCYYVPPTPTNLSVTPALTSTDPNTKLPCVDPAVQNYTVSFSWTNTGAGWWMDVSEDSSFGTYVNHKIDNVTSLFAPDSSWSAPLTFVPGHTYYWRIYNTVTQTPGPSFKYSVCTPPALQSANLDYYILMKDTSIVPADAAAANSYAASKTGLDLMASACPNYKNCWDFMMQESIKAGVSPAWSLAVMSTEGTSMGFVSNSGQTPCGSSFACALPVFLSSVNGAYSGYPKYDASNPYQSYYNWLNVFCGASAPYLCAPPYGSNFQLRVKPIYATIAPGKLIQL